MIKKLFRRRWVCFVYDGGVWIQTRARVGDHGIEVLRLASWITLTSELVTDLGRYLIVSIDAVPLADHVALEKARSHIALSAVFRSGGDLMRYLQIAAVVVPILVSLYIGYSMSSYGATMAQVSELITMLGMNPTISGGVRP